MELTIGLLVLVVVAYVIYHNTKKKPVETAQPEPEAPYKLEPPEPTKCGCGRSSTGYCVGLHKLTEAEWATHADNPNKVAPVVEVNEPEVKETKTKKPRKASATKAEKTATKKTAKKIPNLKRSK